MIFLLELLLRDIPEVLLLLFGLYVFAGQPVEKRQYFLSAGVLVITTILTRALPLNNGVYLSLIHIWADGGPPQLPPLGGADHPLRGAGQPGHALSPEKGGYGGEPQIGGIGFLTGKRRLWKPVSYTHLGVLYERLLHPPDPVLRHWGQLVVP